MTWKSSAAAAAAVVACAIVAVPTESMAQQQASVQTVASGTASWYGARFQGRRTANGERFDKNGMTAAHRSLPFGTRVRVTNRRNGRAVVVRINDRGPFTGGRVIDLSRSAAREIGMVNSGTAPVSIEVVGRGS